MPNAPDIQAVLFDYGMVLTGPPDPTAWDRMKQLTGHDEATLHAAYWAPRHAYDRGDLSGLAYWSQVAGPEAQDPVLTQLIDADTDLWTVPNQPMIDWALRLQRAGIRTGILSNLGDAMMHGVLARFPWLSGFHHLTWSHTLNLAKPELAIYAHAAKGLDTLPNHILFVDDRADNLEAARRAGMHTLRYSTHEAFTAEMHARGLHALLDPPPRSA